MCCCKELPGVVGYAEAMCCGLRDSLRLRACDRDLYLWQCTECGTYWEAVPCSPYWCLARDDQVQPASDDQNPYRNNGYVYQRWAQSQEEWLDRVKRRNLMRQARLLAAVQAYQQLGYTFVDSGGEDGIWVKFDRPLSPDGIERVLVGIDFVGRRYYEARTIVGNRVQNLQRAGEDAGGPWVMG